MCSKFEEFPFVGEVSPLRVRFITLGFLRSSPSKVALLMSTLFAVFEFGFLFLYSQATVVWTSSK